MPTNNAELSIVLKLVNQAKDGVSLFIRQMGDVKRVVEATGDSTLFEGVQTSLTEGAKALESFAEQAVAAANDAKFAAAEVVKLGKAAEDASDKAQDIKIDAETSGLDRTQDELESAKARIEELLVLLTENQDAFKRGFEPLSGSLRGLGVQVDALKAKLSDPEQLTQGTIRGLIQQSEKAIDNVSRLGDAINDVLGREAPDEAKEQLEETEKAANSTSDAVEKANKSMQDGSTVTDLFGASIGATNKLFEQLDAALLKTIKRLTSVVVGFLAVTKLVGGLRQSLAEAVEAERLSISIRALGQSFGFSNAEVAKTISTLQGYGLEASRATQSTLRLLQAGIGLTESTRLGAAAQSLAIATGESASETYDRLVFGVTTLSSRFLRQIGITKNLEQIYQEYAQSLGTSASALDTYQRRLAVISEIERQAINLKGALAESTGTAAQREQQLTVASKDLAQAIGAVLTPAYTLFLDKSVRFITDLTFHIEKLRLLREGVKNTTQEIGASSGALSHLIDGLTNVFLTFISLLDRWEVIIIAVLGVFALKLNIAAAAATGVAAAIALATTKAAGLVRVLSFSKIGLILLGIGFVIERIANFFGFNLPSAVAKFGKSLDEVSEKAVKNNEKLQKSVQEQLNLETKLREFREAGLDTSEIENRLEVTKKQVQDIRKEIALASAPPELVSGLTPEQRRHQQNISAVISNLGIDLQNFQNQITDEETKVLGSLDKIFHEFQLKVDLSEAASIKSTEVLAIAAQRAFEKITSIEGINKALEKFNEVTLFTSEQLSTINLQGEFTKQATAIKLLNEQLSRYQEVFALVERAQRLLTEETKDARDANAALARSFEVVKGDANSLFALEIKQSSEAQVQIKNDQSIALGAIRRAFEVKRGLIEAEARLKGASDETVKRLSAQLDKQEIQSKQQVVEQTLASFRKMRDERIRIQEDLNRRIAEIEQRRQQRTLNREFQATDTARAGLPESSRVLDQRIEAAKLLQEVEADINSGRVRSEDILRKTQQRIERIQQLSGNLAQAGDAGALQDASDLNRRLEILEDSIEESQKQTLITQRKANDQRLNDLNTMVTEATNKLKDFAKEEFKIVLGLDVTALDSVISQIKDKFIKTTVSVNLDINNLEQVKEQIRAFILGGGRAVSSTGQGAAFAHGGLVPGMASTPTQDNMLAWLTSGEFVHPVHAVKHYGVAFMESIRSLTFPRRGFATGGLVASGGSSAPSGDVVTLDLNLNSKRVGSYTSDRQSVRNLVGLLNQVKRGASS